MTWKPEMDYFCQTCGCKWPNREAAIKWWKGYFKKLKESFDPDIYDGCCPSYMMNQGGKTDDIWPDGFNTYDDQLKLERDRKRMQDRRDRGVCISCQAPITEKKPWKGEMRLYSNCASCRTRDTKRRKGS